MMDFRAILGLGLLVTWGVEGCSVPDSLSLSLLSGHKTLQCHLCLDRTVPSRRNYTFTLSRNTKAIRFTQITGQKILYPLDNKKNNTGLWTCKVREFPVLRAEYYLGPPTPAPTAVKKKGTEAASVPASTMSTRILLTIMTAALLLIMLVIAVCLTSGICIMERCRRKSTPHQHHKGVARSDNFPLTENLSSELSNCKIETDTEVSYVDLEIIRDPYRKPSKSHNTIYANIM
ncbi:uncharacterized protein LOC142658872 [Rhinoderma darwinii]|uniref:uncharacterized protein LOC142658872 n=1 Tax=Rhinoderma darwinii TaxID=43563 RepID=UPI003F678F9B